MFSQIANRVNLKENSGILRIILIYSIFFFTVALLKHYTFHSNAWDLSIFDESIWNTTQDRFLFSNMKGYCYLGDHFAPVLLIFVPFYCLGFGAELLIFAQVMFASLGALPLYWLAKDNFEDERLHYLFPLAYLLFLPLWHIITYDFHAVALSIAPLIFAFYYLTKDKYLFSLLFLAFAVTCKENMPVVGAFFGIYILLVKKKKLLGFCLLAMGLLLFIVELQHLIPFFRGGEQGFAYFDRYSYLGNNLGEYVKTALFNPLIIVKNLLIPDKIIYLTVMLGAAAFLPLFSPSTFFLAIPILAQNLLSTYSGQYGYHSQYNSGLIPFLFISAIFGLSNILKNKTAEQQTQIKKRIQRIMVFFIIISLLEFFLGYFIRYTFPTKHTFYGHELLKQIPNHVSVSASSNIHPHLAHRKNIWEFPNGVGQAEYVIIETFDPTWPMEEKDYPDVLDRLWKEKSYKKLFGFFFLGEIRTPVRNKAEHFKEIEEFRQNKNYQILADKHQFLLAKKIE
ncbi:DUF2079 domain-containing protein [Candidatus Margulisiibacteriota bacterium]